VIFTFVCLVLSLVLAFCAGVEYACARRRVRWMERRGGYLDLTGHRGQ
jgi:hypothetical protein